ncbi:MAG: acetylxylan esterase [Pirellulaceae bacterium]|nr:acetylxylan esterase [Pirellulaceae bacterium]
MPAMRKLILLPVLLLPVLGVLGRPVAAESIQQVLAAPILEPEQSLEEVRRYCEQRVPRLARPASREAWDQEAARLRREVLDRVVFRGEAAQWRTAKTRVEWLETIEGGADYQIRKLRYEALPGLWIPALLYQPKQLTGRVPVVLNVNGHDGAGKAARYKQIRCINQVRRGMLALNVEWLGMGQLRSENFQHYRMNQLDLCGTSGLAPFYLAMQRGLDLLLAHENADPERVAVAGLSGGGWQTIVISSLDTRVTLANPVAGYSSYLTRARYPSDLGDSEQTPTDLATVVDYTHLTAMLAPRAALLTFNQSDNCCFAAPHALPPLWEAAAPVYALYGRAEALRSHINHDPGTHNFEQDNREALYRMFGEHFAAGDEQFSAAEIECSGELKSAEQLRVELPEDNLDFHQLAKRLAASLPRHAELPDDAARADAWRSDARQRLQRITRAGHYEVRAEQAGSASGDGFQASRWKLRMGDDWTVPAVVLEPEKVQTTVVLLDDAGRTALNQRAAELLQQNCRVVLVDPFYFGESKIAGRDFLYALLVSAVGERPLGVQAGQVSAVARWLKSRFAEQEVVVESHGRRTSLITLVAAGLEPAAITGVRLHGALDSLHQVLAQNGSVDKTPELFCFGLLAEFDVPQLKRLTDVRP